MVLIDSIRSSINAVSLFGTLEALYTFITTYFTHLTSSLPRLKIFENEQKQIDGLEITLKQLSETIWISHKHAISPVYTNLSVIVRALKRIADKL